MSKTKETHDSDDEFHDAVEEPTTTSAAPGTTVSPTNSKSQTTETYDDAIGEITEKQGDLKLSEEIEAIIDGKETDEEAAVEKETEAEIIEDFVDDNTLREAEKLMSAEELENNKLEADKLKLEGNDLFKKDEAERAIEIYDQALQICPTTYPKERAVLFGNRAAAKIKIDSKKSAIEDCSKAIELWPEYVRAILRRAKLYELDDKLDEALEDYKRACELDPGQQEAREAMVRLPPLINERNERLKEEMMSKLKDLGNMILKPFGLSTSNFQMQQDPNSGSYSINFNQNGNSS